MTSHDGLRAARARRDSSHKIFIFCDDASHAPREVAVTNFREVPEGTLMRRGWHEEPASKAPRRPGTGMTMVGNVLPADGWANDPNVKNDDLRSRFELTCRKCRTRPVPVQEHNLFPVLDALRDLGQNRASLKQIVAMLQRQSEVNTDD